jgi:hypothetical protein
MGIEYDFSIKDAEDAASVDAGVEGWDAVIQINNVISRRYAASTPISLISRTIDFRGTGTDGGTGGLQLDTGGLFTLLDVGSIGSTTKAKNLLFIPTMVGLMVHPQTTGTMVSAFGGSIAVRNSGTGSTALLTASFSLTCSAATLNNTTVGGLTPMTNITGTAASVIVPVPTTTLPTAGAASSFKGYYYLCPVNKGWWQHPVGNVCGGSPMRGFTIQNSSISPFIPDGDLTDPDVNYASSNTYSQIVLQANAGTNTARFSIIDLYGIIIPSASAV